MSLPRQVLEGKTYLITRRTRERRFFLRPSAVTNAIICFCVAWAAARTGVLIHVQSWMSSHPHIVCTDVRGQHPKFTHWLFRHVSVCLKLVLGISENFWKVEKPSVVELTTPAAIMEAMAYTLANPVEAGLVRRSKLWPGVISRPEDLLGVEVEAPHPGVYFRRYKATTLKYAMPPLLADRDPADVVESLKARVRELEDAAAEELRRRGKKVLGVDRIMKSDPFSKPTTPEKDRESDGRVPTFKTLSREATEVCRDRLLEFRRAYYASLEVLQRGDWTVEFPLGTWWLRVHLGVRVTRPD